MRIREAFCLRCAPSLEGECTELWSSTHQVPLANSYILWLVLPIPVLSIHDLSTVRSGYGPLMKVSARSAGGQVCILHLARFNDFPGTKIVAIEPVQKTKPREKMAYLSLTAKLEWLTLVRPAATARAHSRSRNAFGEETLTSCLTRVGGPEIGWGVRQDDPCCEGPRI